MTLIEVVGGLGLLATLLVAVLLAKARYTRQAANADRRLAAVAAADAMLAAWYQNPVSLPRSAVGRVPGDARFSWRTQIVNNADIKELEAEVVRLEILDNREEGVDPVLTSVEFVIEPHPENTASDTSGTPNPQQGSHRKHRAAGTDKSGAAPGAPGNRR